MLLKKLKDANMEDVRSENPELFSAIKALGSAEAGTKLQSLQADLDAAQLKAQNAEAELAKMKSAEAIRSFGSKIGQLELANKLVADGVPQHEAYEKLAASFQSDGKKNEENLRQLFDQTAPPAAGESAGESEMSFESWEDAVKYVQGRDNCSYAAATRTAITEFKSLHTKTFHGGE